MVYISLKIKLHSRAKTQTGTCFEESCQWVLLEGTVMNNGPGSERVDLGGCLSLWRALVSRTKSSDGSLSVSYSIKFTQLHSPLTLPHTHTHIQTHAWLLLSRHEPLRGCQLSLLSPTSGQEPGGMLTYAHTAFILLCRGVFLFIHICMRPCLKVLPGNFSISTKWG